jgi:hypothetical protein
MKTLLVSKSLAFLFLPLFALSAQAIPSTLADCRLKNWVDKRLPETDSVSFKKSGQSCIAHFQIDDRTPRINDGSRAEIEDPLRLPVGSALTYQFSTYIPSDLDKNDVPNLVFAQWHDNKRVGQPVQRPPLSIRLKNGRLVMPFFNQDIIDRLGPNSPGEYLYDERASFDQWIHWKVKVFWAKNERGLIQVWMNGKKVVHHRGLIGYPSDPTAPYFKLGIYTIEEVPRKLTVLHTGFRRTYSAADWN